MFSGTKAKNLEMFASTPDKISVHCEDWWLIQEAMLYWSLKTLFFLVGLGK